MLTDELVHTTICAFINVERLDQLKQFCRYEDMHNSGLTHVLVQFSSMNGIYIMPEK